MSPLYEECLMMLRVSHDLKVIKGCLDWDSFATFLRLFSDADAQVRKRRDSFASSQAIQGADTQK